MLTFIINVIFSCLVFTFVFLKPITEKVNLQYYGLLFAILILTEVFALLNIPSAFLIVGISLLYIIIITKNRLLNAILSLFSYFLVVVINYLLFLLLQNMFHISVEKVYSSLAISIITNICLTTLVFALTSLVGWYAKKYLKPTSFNRYQKLFSLVLIEILLAIAVLIFNIDYGQQLGYPNDIVIYNCILFLLYFLLSTLLLLNVVKMTRKNMEAEQREIEYSQLLDYIKDLEQTSQTLRKFRHDYLNILLSMDLMIHNKEFDQLITYFDTNIKPEGRKIASMNLDISNLSHILDPAIKGIIAHKLQMARLHGITIKIGAMEDITEFYITPFDLARILGIFLDNAIEAASEQPKPFIGIAFASQEGHVTILVENTCTPEAIPIEHLAEDGFSTKGENRGHGLHNVEEILSTYPNALHYMRQKGNVFSQTLHLYSDKGKQ